MDFLFDIGRVLLDFDFENSLRTVVPAGSDDADARLARLLGRKDELETGNINGPEFTRWAVDVLGCDAAAFTTAWREIFTPIPPMWDAVRRLKAQGHRLILFSNTNDIHCPWAFERFPEFGLFDAAVLSFEVGAMKPSSEIYQHAAGRFGLTPQRTLYIDDLPENIATGNQLGFRCHRYDLRDHPAFERWLDAELRA